MGTEIIGMRLAYNSLTYPCDDGLFGKYMMKLFVVVVFKRIDCVFVCVCAAFFCVRATTVCYKEIGKRAFLTSLKAKRIEDGTLKYRRKIKTNREIE